MTGDNYNGRLLLLSLRTITVMRRELQCRGDNKGLASST